MKRAFQIEFERGIYSAGFYIGVLLLVAAGVIEASMMLEYILTSGVPGEEVRWIAAVCQSLYSESLDAVVPIACTLAISASYLEDTQSGTLYYVMLRTTKKRYRYSKIFTCAIFGMLTVCAAVLIFSLIFIVILPMNKTELGYFKQQGFDYYFPILQRILNLALNGAFYSVLGGVIASFVNNRYMAYAAPFIFYYVISTLTGAYLPKLYFLNPAEWISAQRSSSMVILLILLGLNMVVLLGYSKIIERRWKND